MQSFPDTDFGREPIIPLQSLGICIGDRDIAGLHADKFPMALEIVIFGQDLCSYKFFLERGDIVQ